MHGPQARRTSQNKTKRISQQTEYDDDELDDDDSFDDDLDDDLNDSDDSVELISDMKSSRPPHKKGTLVRRSTMYF